MSKKRKKVILILLVVLAVVLIGCLVALNSLEKPKEDKPKERVDATYTKEDIKVITDSVESYVEDKVVPSGISRLYGKYKGDNELSDFYRGIKKVTDYFPTIQQKLSGKADADIKQYFDSNKDEVLKNTGISDEEEFVKFAKYILEFESLQNLKSAAIDTSTITSDANFLMMNLTISYEDGQEVKLKGYFKNEEDNKNPLFKFIVAE